MKTTSTILVAISKARLVNLTTIVNETLDVKLTSSAARTFSAGDLWNIQRRSRGAVKRRQFA